MINRPSYTRRRQSSRSDATSKPVTNKKAPPKKQSKPIVAKKAEAKAKPKQSSKLKSSEPKGSSKPASESKPSGSSSKPESKPAEETKSSQSKEKSKATTPEERLEEVRQELASVKKDMKKAKPKEKEGLLKKQTSLALEGKELTEKIAVKQRKEQIDKRVASILDKANSVADNVAKAGQSSGGGAGEQSQKTTAAA